MSQAISDPQSSSSTPYQQDDEFAYKSMSRAAVLSFAFGLFGLLAWISPLLLFLPACGVVFGIVAFRNLKKFPNELIGSGIARIGMILSVCLLVASPIRHIYIYNTEVPEGYERIQFAWLKSATGAPDSRSDCAQWKEGFSQRLHPSNLCRQQRSQNLCFGP